MKRIIEEYWQLVVAVVIVAFICCLMFGGCASTNHLRETTKMVQVDTVYVSSVVHDTLKTVMVVHDSVDRVVERTVYVDSNGVVHEKEVERLTRLIDRNAEQYKATNQMLTEKIARLEEQLKEKEEIKVVEKKVYVWWPCLVLVGLILAVGVWWLVEYGFNKLAKKEGEI